MMKKFVVGICAIAFVATAFVATASISDKTAGFDNVPPNAMSIAL